MINLEITIIMKTKIAVKIAIAVTCTIAFMMGFFIKLNRFRIQSNRYSNGSIISPPFYHCSILEKKEQVRKQDTAKEKGIPQAVPSFLELVDGLRTQIFSLRSKIYSLLAQTKAIQARHQTTKKEGTAQAVPSFLELVDGLEPPTC